MDRLIGLLRRRGLMLFLLALFLRILAIGHPIEVDSFHWLREGADFLRSLLTGDLAETYGGAHPGVTSMWLVGIGLALEHTVYHLLGRTNQALLPWLNEILASPYPGLSHYVWVRLVFAPITAGLLVAIYHMGDRAFDRRIAALATALLLFEPYYLAHARVIVPDALASSFVLLAMLAMLTHLRHRGGTRYLLLSGLCLGLAIMSKLPTILAGPILALWLIADEVTVPWAERRGLGGLLHALILLTLVTLLTCWAIWPALWTTPGATLARWWANLTQKEMGSRLSFFLGHRTFDPGPLFYPVVLLFRCSPVTLIGVFVAVVIGATRRRIEHGWPAAALASFSLFFMAMISLDASKIDRYLLPALPPLAFIAALGWLAAADMPLITRRISRRLSLAAVVLAQAGLALAFYPDYFSYYNPLLGGPRVAQKVVVVGVGEGLDVAAQRLASLSNATELTVAAWYPGSFAPHFPGHTVKMVAQDADSIWNWARSHFVVSYINQWQRKSNQEIIAYFKGQAPFDVVRLHGVNYALIFPGPIARPEDAARLGQPSVNFGRIVRLRGVEAASPKAEAGRDAVITLYWEPVASFETEDFLVTLVLRDVDGHEWVRSHGPPVGGFLPLRVWHPGMLIRDAQHIHIPAGMPPGTYQLLIGWYSPSTGRTLTARRADGIPIGDMAPVLSLQVATSPAGIPLDAPSATPADIIWGSIRLAGWHLAEGRYPEGGTLPLTLYWRATRDAPSPIRIRLALEAPNGGSWQRPGFHEISPRYPPERWRSKELVLERWDALLPAGLPDGEYTAILEARDDAGHLLGQQRLGRVEIASRPHMFTLPKPQHVVDARFGERIRLLGYDVAPAARPGEPLQVVLYWQATAEIDTSYKVFIHVLNPREHIMGQSDHIPQHG
ncbi:MAG: glycosyltransferase family 39 protein, partial [Anaerolineae bacterium]|nr:glycosyltransferase family 39 protein [Anaerolineae bacterium]